MIHLGPFMLNWHGLFTALGILAGWYVAHRMARRFGVAADDVSRLLPLVVIAAVLGGRVAYIVSHWGDFAGNWWEIVRIDRGGLASHGALLFGIAAVYGFARRNALPAGRLLDALALAVPINYLAMRIGNFLIGELYGDPTDRPWGMVFPGAGGPRHPAQVYDGVGQILVMVLLIRFASRSRPPGALAWTTLAATSLVRLVSDLFRTELRVLGPLTGGQAAALVTLAVSLFMLWTTGRSTRPASGMIRVPSKP